MKYTFRVKPTGERRRWPRRYGYCLSLGPHFAPALYEFWAVDDAEARKIGEELIRERHERIQNEAARERANTVDVEIDD